MAESITTFLMFQGKAEQAMELYVSLFDNARIVERERYGAGEAGTEGSIKRAVIELCGQSLIVIDSPVPNDFDFTPSMSLFVACETEDELTDLFARLGENGEVMMPVDNYGFSRKFAWVKDRFGVSWQLNLD